MNLNELSIEKIGGVARRKLLEEGVPESIVDDVVLLIMNAATAGILKYIPNIVAMLAPEFERIAAEKKG